MMNRKSESFDYRSFAKKYNISPNVLENIVHEVKAEFPNDEMLAELHIIRALKEYAKKVH